MATKGQTVHCRPPLALRVGITGARNLRADQVARIEQQLGTVLAAIKDRLHELAGKRAVHAGYVCSVPGKLDASLIYVSPLARGADRLAARKALEAGYQLFVPMPFHQEEYEHDFVGSSPDKPQIVQISGAEDLAEFRGLLKQAASCFGLDGARNGTGNAFEEVLESTSYEAVGRYVVRHSDVLIAIWDGKPSGGRGGTAEIVEYAARSRVPTWWIHAEGTLPAQLLLELQDLRKPRAEAALEAELEALRTYLGKLITPPRPEPLRPPSPTDFWFGKHSHAEVSFARVYFDETPLRSFFLWKTYSRVMKLLSGVSPPWSAPQRPQEQIAGYWFDYYETADSYASGYANRYRTSYVLMILFSMMALIFGALAPGLAWDRHMHWLARSVPFYELAMLIGIVTLLVASSRGDWHRRSIEYRLLAELTRKQQMLAPLGWSVPVASVQHMATREWAWISWLFAALQRASPLPQADAANREMNEENCRILTALINEQLAYHKDRRTMAEEASKRLEILVLVFFLLVWFAVVLKIIGELRDWNHNTVSWMGFAATALPAVSAAFVALRSYSELQMLAEQSFHMHEEMVLAKARVAGIALGQPLASQELGAEASAIAAAMLQDLEGWGRLFRGKAMEAG